MGNRIEREGTYRGQIIDRAISATQNGFPQFVAEIAIEEYYSPETEEYIDVSDEQYTIIGYFVLFGAKNKPTLNATQLMKATGWDGRSFDTLLSEDLDARVMIRVEQNTYNNKTSLQVQFIDNYDGEPTRQLRSLSGDEVKKMNLEYRAALKELGGSSKPTTTPKGDSFKDKKTTTPPKSGPPTKSNKGKKGKEETPGLSFEEAWEKVISIFDGDEDQAGEAWLAAIGDRDPDAMEPQEWAKLVDDIAK